MESFELEGAAGLPVRGEVHGAANGGPGLILCHGFKGFARGGFFPLLAERFTAEGFRVVTFDFSGSGIGPDRESFTEREAFAHDTFTRQLHDLAVVRQHARAQRWIGERWGLFGFSRGGGVAVLHAARDASVGALVTWSAISDVVRWSAEEQRAWRERGFAEIHNSRTGDVLPISTDLLDEIDRLGATELSVRDAAARVRAPWLIVHGEADETVPVHEGRQLHTASDNRAELLLVPGASHTYNARHQVMEPTPELAIALDRTIRFFGANLT